MQLLTFLQVWCWTWGENEIINHKMFTKKCYAFVEEWEYNITSELQLQLIRSMCRRALITVCQSSFDLYD